MSECKRCKELEDELEDLQEAKDEQCSSCAYDDHAVIQACLHAAQAVIYELHLSRGICLCEHCNSHRCNR